MSAVTYEEIEYRNYAVLAKTARTSIALRNRSSFLKRHLSLTWDLVTLEVQVRSLLGLYHAPIVVRSRMLENASTEQLACLAAQMESTHERLSRVVEVLKDKLEGSFYDILIEKLERRTEEWGALIESIRTEGSTTILLTERDQAKLIRSLFELSEPTDKLTEAFHRYHS